MLHNNILFVSTTILLWVRHDSQHKLPIQKNNDDRKKLQRFPLFYFYNYDGEKVLVSIFD